MDCCCHRDPAAPRTEILESMPKFGAGLTYGVWRGDPYASGHVFSPTHTIMSQPKGGVVTVKLPSQGTTTAATRGSGGTTLAGAGASPSLPPIGTRDRASRQSDSDTGRSDATVASLRSARVSSAATSSLPAVGTAAATTSHGYSSREVRYQNVIEQLDDGDRF